MKRNAVVFEVDEAVVTDIQTKDYRVRSMRDVITNLIESHAGDTSVNILESPVFLRYQEMVADAQRAFDDAKTEMLRTVVGEEQMREAEDWELDYNTQKLTLSFLSEN